MSPSRADALLAADFASLPDLIRAHSHERPDAIAVADPDGRINWRDFDALIDRIAARLHSEGVGPGAATALAGLNSIAQVAVFMATLRVGAVAGLITNTATGAQMAAMIIDSGARHLFLDEGASASLSGQNYGDLVHIALDDSVAGEKLSTWMAPIGAMPHLFFWHHRHAQGHCAQSCDAVAAYSAGRTCIWPGRRHNSFHTALFEYDDGLFFADDGVWRYGGPDEEVQRAGLFGTGGARTCDQYNACSCTISPDHGAPRI
jgi:AMP-binding enzyme